MGLDGNTLNDLDSVLIEIVEDTSAGPWREKANLIRAELSERGNKALDEFISWFDEE